MYLHSYVVRSFWNYPKIGKETKKHHIMERLDQGHLRGGASTPAKSYSNSVLIAIRNILIWARENINILTIFFFSRLITMRRRRFRLTWRMLSGLCRGFTRKTLHHLFKETVSWDWISPCTVLMDRPLKIWESMRHKCLLRSINQHYAWPTPDQTRETVPLSFTIYYDRSSFCKLAHIRY